MLIVYVMCCSCLVYNYYVYSVVYVYNKCLIVFVYSV